MLTNSKQDTQEENSTSGTVKTVKTETFEGYTQREWDRIVGYGTVPEHYKKKTVK